MTPQNQDSTYASPNDTATSSNVSFQNSSNTLGNKKGVVVASLNVNSLLLHIDEIRLLVKDHGIHVLAINETKLDTNVDDDLVSIDGFSIKRCDRNRSGGGVAIYINDALIDKCTVRDDIPVFSLEALCIELKPTRSAPFIVLAWYRPPNALNEVFNDLEKSLQTLDREGKEIIILGDTNCDILPNYSSDQHSKEVNLQPQSNRLLQIYNLFGLHQLIETATRETTSSSTLIDHIATTNKLNVVESGVRHIGLSDHYLIYMVRKFNGSLHKQHKSILTRSMKNFDETQFLNDLLSVDWKSIVSNTDDISIVVENWSNMFSVILEKHAPMRNRRVSEKFSPWLTKEFRKLSASRDKLRKQAVRSKSEILQQAYRQLRNKVNKLNMDLKRKYFTDKITSFQGDIKSTWKVINQVINKKSKTTNISTLNIDGNEVSSSTGIAESMNNFFCNIGNDLSSKIPHKENPLLENEYQINEEKSEFHFQPISIRQVEQVLGKFKSSMGFGTDGIANFFLKVGLPVIAESLCNIFNLSLATNIFPDSWRVARVAPIFKSGQRDDRSNYRPISVLPFLARVFEKLVYNQVYEYLDKNKLLFSHQSGFRSLHSTVTCLLKSTDDWYVNMDQGKYTGMVFIDLKKAFDTVDHEILLAKLKKYGIDGADHSWFKSYLQNRLQFCKVNGTSSSLQSVDCGVPQGSCLGPLLFLMYINDLPMSLRKCNVTMYADDTSISHSTKDINDLNFALNSDLDRLKGWLQGNKLSLNVIKTQAMVVGSRPNLKNISDKKVEAPAFVIDGAEIDIVNNVKYLGVKLDDSLAWDLNTQYLSSKISRALGFLKYAKKIVPKDTLIKMYHGIVEPHFRYCCSVWGGCGETKLQILQKLQNRAARIVTNSSFDVSVSNLIKDLKWQTVNDMIKCETATITYKALSGLAPGYLSNIFKKNSARGIKMNLRNATADVLVPRMKTCNGQRAISFRGAKTWNNLPMEVKLAPSLSTFKNRLRRQVFNF